MHTHKHIDTHRNITCTGMVDIVWYTQQYAESVCTVLDDNIQIHSMGA